MARSTWHPYAPDQAFGHQAAVDEDRLDEALAQLERNRQHPPRAGSKAKPAGDETRTTRVAPAGVRMAGWVGSAAGLPVTTNIALDAAAALRSEVD
jgi:hypothetical protein